MTQEPGNTFIDWSRDFSVVPGRDPQEVVTAVTAVAAQEVATITEHFARRRRGAAAAP